MSRNHLRSGSVHGARDRCESWASDYSVGPTSSVATFASFRDSLPSTTGPSSLSMQKSTSSSSPHLIFNTMPRRSSVTHLDSSVQPARLVYYTTLGGKTSFSLFNDETSIGRKEDNQIVLHDAKISKYHAVIEKKDGKYYIRDRRSSNGIRVNDITIDPNVPYQIQDGDCILIGSIQLFFYDEVVSDSASVMSSSDLPTLGRRRTSTNDQKNYWKLVTILPNDQKYDETVHIRAEIEADEEVDFKKIELVKDVNTLKEDYEKLRLAYELSKVSLDNDLSSLLAKSMDLMFEILPVDRGVVLLVDQKTGFLATNYVKLREGKANEKREILLSSTILKKVYYSRKCLVTSDACEDPMLGKAASVKYGQFRSVICVPLIAHGKVLGILHLDSRERISTFSSKDLSLVKTISNQTAMAIENSILLKEVENKAKITEQLSRFLAPHVVDKMLNKAEIIRKGGREIVGTIIFADIRGFTNLSEQSGPSEVVALLNDYFERLVRVVFKYDGVVDKYIGDELMAVFGSLEQEVDPEFRAVAAGIEFIKEIKDMNADRARFGKDPIAIGVGINTGELLAGFIGCSQRLEYTCIGDTVNTSSRICSMAQRDQVLISEFTYEKVKDRIRAHPVGYRQFKGKQKEVMVYEVVGFTDDTS